MTAEAPPPPRLKRPMGLTLAWLACWHVAILAVVVPGVIAYQLGPLCLEEGWANVLATRPGLFLLLLLVLSSISTLAWIIAGMECFRGRGRSGSIWTGVAVGTGLLTGVVIAAL